MTSRLESSASPCGRHARGPRADRCRHRSGPGPGRMGPTSGPRADRIRTAFGPHPDRQAASCPPIDDSSAEIIALGTRLGINTDPVTRLQSTPMRLDPKLPPGRSSRKALRYVREVRRLRAEGHTLESIRLALLDAGVSVSLSTVRREAARPPSSWELDRELELRHTLQRLQQDTAASSVTARSPPASTGQQASSKGGLLSRIGGVLRRLHPSRWFA